MTAKIVEQKDRIGLIAGLNWHVITKKGRAREKEVRALAAGGDASKVVIVESGAVSVVGLYDPREVDFDEVDEGDDGVVRSTKPKQLHSLAAAFAEAVGGGYAVLLLTRTDVGKDKSIVIAVGNGVPQTDQIKGSIEAIDVAVSYSNGSQGVRYKLYTDDRSALSDGEPISMEQIWAKVGKSNQIVRTPVNLVAVMAGIAAVGLIAAGAYGYITWQEAEAKKERQRQAALANPTPKYVAALRAREGALGVNSATVQALLAHMRSQPLLVAGWTLAKDVCTVEPAQCTTSWERAGGTTDRLIAARAPFGETISGASTNELVLLVSTVQIPLAGVSSKTELPFEAAAVENMTPIAQIWTNARVSVSVGTDGYKAWPQVPGIEMASVRKDELVRARSVEIKASPELLAQAVTMAPANIWWNEVSINVKLTGKASDSLSANLKGKSYVR